MFPSYVLCNNFNNTFRHIFLDHQIVSIFTSCGLRIVLDGAGVVGSGNAGSLVEQELGGLSMDLAHFEAGGGVLSGVELLHSELEFVLAREG